MTLEELDELMRGVPHATVHKMVALEVRLGCGTLEESALRIAEWYLYCEAEITQIHIVGLAEWTAYNRQAKVWATMHGLRAKGYTSGRF